MSNQCNFCGNPFESNGVCHSDILHHWCGPADDIVGTTSEEEPASTKRMGPEPEKEPDTVRHAPKKCYFCHGVGTHRAGCSEKS